MARNPRENFEAERERISDIGDADVRAALLDFADALDPDYNHAQLPKPRPDGRLGHETTSLNTGKGYLSALRCAHQRGLDLLDADAETVNNFMRDLVTDPGKRRYDLVDYSGSITKPSAKSWQSALRAFYRYCDEPGVSDDRPETTVAWPADSIIMFSERSKPKHDEADMPEQADLDAMREACLSGQNTRRDQAFLELAAGTGQRVYALVTLRVGDVHLDGDVPHILLNPEIDGAGDKAAIVNAGRKRPIVTNTEPVRQWINHHPLRDPEVRTEHGAPDDFDDCYLFVGSLRQRSTNASSHWSTEAARNMLDRRKADTADLHGVKTVEIPVNPHNWRHYAYTQSQELPIDESDRRKWFGWAPGSDTGQRIYGHQETEQAVERITDAWAEAFGTDDAPDVAAQVSGDPRRADVSAMAGMLRELLTDDGRIDPDALAEYTADGD